MGSRQQIHVNVLTKRPYLKYLNISQYKQHHFIMIFVTPLSQMLV